VTRPEIHGPWKSALSFTGAAPRKFREWSAQVPPTLSVADIVMLWFICFSVTSDPLGAPGHRMEAVQCEDRP
jgi:hypothetical protein